MKSYDRILRAARVLPWAIQPEKLEAIFGFLEVRASGHAVDPHTLERIRAAQMEAAARREALSGGANAVAVLPLYGVIGHRMNLMMEVSGGTSTDQFTQQFRQAIADPNVRAVVVDVDSPGGTVDGVPELADEIFKARGKKPVIAVANTLVASAAYWIASACSEIVASPSANLGSIGVYMVHEDDSAALAEMGVKMTIIKAGKYKAEGNPYEPLPDEARAAMKAQIDEYYGMFVKAVARGRGVKAEDVRNGFGEGRCVSAQQAVTLGMADRIATLDQVLAKYGVSRSNSSAMAADSQRRAPQSAVAAAIRTDEDGDADGDEQDDDVACECECEACRNGECASCESIPCDAPGCRCESAMTKKRVASATNRIENATNSDTLLARMRDEITLASLS